MGWLAGRLFQRLVGQPADIAVAIELAPGPAFTVAVIDGRALALERLRREFRVGRRFATKRRQRIRDFEFLAGDKAGVLDLAFEIFGGEVGPRWREARIIINSGGSGAGRWRAPPGIRRPRVGRVWRSASIHKYRHADNSWLLQRSAGETTRR